MRIDTVLTELRRELAMRQRHYPNWIVQGRIAKNTAELRIKCIQRAIEELEDKHGIAQQGAIKF